MSPILVVIPACNEEEAMPSALEALTRAVDFARSMGFQARCLIVCDSCEDETFSIASNWVRGENQAVQVAFRNVGSSRDFGVRMGLSLWPDTKWIAFTDGDSEVESSAAAAAAAAVFSSQSSLKLRRHRKCLHENQKTRQPFRSKAAEF